jgi:hypothetical protein
VAERLNRFDRYRSCPKCGGTWVTARYIGGRDLIARNCERCGHTWTELPLDRPAAVAGSATPTERDDELARLREFVAAHDAVEELVTDFTDDRDAYNAAVQRFDHARAALAGSATPTGDDDDPSA